MSTLVISDTHFTKSFETKRFAKIAELIDIADNVIINGDFWEGFQISFDEFLKSKWNRLFPLLKAKNAIYIYGNHDTEKLSDQRVKQFCSKAVESYQLELSEGKYFFTHGQYLLFPRNSRETIEKMGNKLVKMKLAIESQIQHTMFFLFGPNVFPAYFNKMTLEERKSAAPLDYLLVCGHSHKPQHKKDINFIDIGFFNYGWANYMLIDDKGKFEFRSEKY